LALEVHAGIPNDLVLRHPVLARLDWQTLYRRKRDDRRLGSSTTASGAGSSLAIAQDFATITQTTPMSLRS
jgi:hypothetical protein